MSEVSAGVLQQQVAQIQRIEQQDKWFKKSELGKLQQQIHEAFSALPMPVARLDEFDNCRVDYHLCLQWLQQGCAASNNATGSGPNACWSNITTSSRPSRVHRSMTLRAVRWSTARIPFWYWRGRQRQNVGAGGARRLAAAPSGGGTGANLAVGVRPPLPVK